MTDGRRGPSRRDWFRLAAGGALLVPAAEGAASAFQFADMARPAGLAAARNTSGAPINKTTLLEEMGAGVALIDYDNDGWLDIFLVNGSTLGGPGSASPTSYLFHNNRDGTFRDVTRRAGLTRTGWGQGCCVGDYDNDGFDDLYVSYWGGGALYRNNGDGTFTDVSARAGVAGSKGVWGAGCCFLDFDRDGHLDLFVASYVNFDPVRAPRPGQSPLCRYNEIAVPCGPQGFAGGVNRLYRNRGDGTFEDVSERSGIVNPRGSSSAASFRDRDWRPTGSYGMGAVSADFDNDGWPDIYVACDTAPSLLYRNNHDGTFREIAAPAGCAFDENGTALSGMGAAVADYDGDGWLDIVRTNFSDQITTLYRNNGDGSFQDASIGAGMGVNRKYLGFGVGFGDFDNDGWKDIFIANGHVYAQLASRKLHIGYRQRRTLYRNLGNGRFADVSPEAGPGILAEHSGRGCAIGDLDNDGLLEIAVNNIDAAPSLLRNSARNANHWLIVKLRGVRSNRSAIGARVTLESGGRTQIDEVMSGSSYYSQNDLRLHFGLGAAARIDKLTVRWPSGLTETAGDLAADRILTIIEGEGVKK